MSNEQPAARIGYVINQYPMPSHTFIRSEIRELERQGVAIERYSVRGWDAHIVDPLDREERGRTRYLLGGGVRPLMGAAIALALRYPGRFFKALASSLRLSRSSDRGLVKHLAYLLEACLLVQWARKVGVTHLHAHFGTNAADVVLHANQLGGASYSFTVHGPAEFDAPRQVHIREKMQGASFVVAITSFCRSQLFRWADSHDWRKVKIVHCGLDDDYIGADFVPPPKQLRLVCVGRLCEQKGQLLLLDAVRIVRARGVAVELVLAGDGEMRADLEAAIRDHGLTDAVTITGVLDADRVRAALIAANALVLASFAEGLPVVIMEAMALGRPIISTQIAGIPELVREGREGFLVTAGDLDGLADAILRMLSLDSASWETMAMSCRERVRERHDIRTEAAKLARLFRGVGH